MTKSALLVHQVLNSDFSNISKMSEIYTNHMSNEQFEKLSESFGKGGYTLNKGEGATSTITKK